MLNVQANGVNVGSVQQPGNQGPANSQSPAPLVGTNDPQRILEILSYSRHSVDELRLRGIPENVIKLVKTHPVLLQRAFQAQTAFQNSIVNSQNTAHIPQSLPGTSLFLCVMIVLAHVCLSAHNAQQSMPVPAMQNAATAGRPSPEAMEEAVQMMAQLKVDANQHLPRGKFNL